LKGILGKKNHESALPKEAKGSKRVSLFVISRSTYELKEQTLPLKHKKRDLSEPKGMQCLHIHGMATFTIDKRSKKDHQERNINEESEKKGISGANKLGAECTVAIKVGWSAFV